MPSRNRHDSNKVSIIGCGKVGMTSAYSLLHTGLVNELVLYGRHKAELIGEQLDLEHGLSFLPYAQVTASDSYDDLADSDVVIISAGVAQKPGETRLDLIKSNRDIISQIIPEVVRVAPKAVILMISNPVDALTYHAYKIAGLPKGQIFGSGTTLDTARFRFHLSEFLRVNPNSIHAYVLGEHGDSSFPVFSSAMVGGQPLMSLPNFSLARAQTAYNQARDAAYRIIAAKGATYYAIGSTVAHIVRCILTDARTILPVSIPLHQYMGEWSGVSVSVPAVVGRAGVLDTLEIKLSWEEKQQLNRSIEAVRQFC